MKVENNTVVILLLKDLCCIGSLASQAALRDRLTGTGADKHGAANYRGNMHGITRTFTRTGLTAAGAVAVAVAVAVILGKGNGHFLQTCVRVPSHVVLLRYGCHVPPKTEN